MHKIIFSAIELTRAIRQRNPPNRTPLTARPPRWMNHFSVIHLRNRAPSQLASHEQESYWRYRGEKNAKDLRKN